MSVFTYDGFGKHRCLIYKHRYTSWSKHTSSYDWQIETLYQGSRATHLCIINQLSNKLRVFL